VDRKVAYPAVAAVFGLPVADTSAYLD
jgi:hypothetical protein